MYIRTREGKLSSHQSSLAHTGATNPGENEGETHKRKEGWRLKYCNAKQGVPSTSPHGTCVLSRCVASLSTTEQFVGPWPSCLNIWIYIYYAQHSYTLFLSFTIHTYAIYYLWKARRRCVLCTRKGGGERKGRGPRRLRKMTRNKHCYSARQK